MKGAWLICLPQPQGDHRGGQATSWAACQPSAVAPSQSEGKEGGRSSSHSCTCTPPGASTRAEEFLQFD